MYFFCFFNIYLNGDNLKNKKIKNEISKNKYKYLFLIVIITVGIISGIIFSNILSYNDKKIIADTIKNYFSNLENGQNINFYSLINSLSVNLVYVFLIFLFSLSIVGIILNPIILYFKSFLIGISVGIMINLYSYKGIILGLLNVFPHQIINVIMYLFLSFYGIKFSIKLFQCIFLKKQFNFSIYLKKYLKVIGVTSIILIISAFYETFLANFIIKVFTFLIK